MRGGMGPFAVRSPPSLLALPRDLTGGIRGALAGGIYAPPPRQAQAPSFGKVAVATAITPVSPLISLEEEASLPRPHEKPPARAGGGGGKPPRPPRHSHSHCALVFGGGVRPPPTPSKEKPRQWDSQHGELYLPKKVHCSQVAPAGGEFVLCSVRGGWEKSGGRRGAEMPFGRRASVNTFSVRACMQGTPRARHSITYLRGDVLGVIGRSKSPCQQTNGSPPLGHGRNKRPRFARGTRKLSSKMATSPQEVSVPYMVRLTRHNSGSRRPRVRDWLLDLATGKTLRTNMVPIISS